MARITNPHSRLLPRLLRRTLARRGSIAAPLERGWEGELRSLVETRRLVPLLMSDAAALQIQVCVRAARRLDGAMAECGVLMGGSARLICEAKGDRELHLFDLFETLQSPPSRDRSGLENELREHFKSTHGTLAGVQDLLAPYPNVHVHPGMFPSSVPPQVAELTFSFVHLDMDLAASTRSGLEFFHPRLAPGGIIIGDDYNDAEVRATFGDYFKGRPDTIMELPWGQVMAVKQGR